MATKTTELATVDGAPGHADIVKFFEDPEANVPRFEEDPDEIAKRIAARDLAATSADELFGEQGDLAKAKDLIGKPIELRSVEWRSADEQFTSEGALPFFGIFTATTTDGEIVTFSCGAAAVVRKAAVAASKGWLPKWVKLVQLEKTKSGYTPLSLVAVDAPVPGRNGQAAF